jgi:hypothetical protein
VGDFVAETYLGFVYWSMLTSLGVTIWYFPLWHMGISGFEALLFITLSPFLLGISSVCTLVAQRPAYVHLASLISPAAYLVRDPVLRLCLVSLGLGIANLVWCGEFHAWATTNASKFHRGVMVFALGLILSSVAKMAFWTNNPIWPIMNAENGGWNKTGILLAILACVRLAQRTVPTTYTGGKVVGKGGSTAVIAFGLGMLVFGLHTFLCDSSTLILWVWDGFPVTGPLVIPHGVVTIVAMGLGLLASSHLALLQTWPPLAVAALGASFLYKFHGWWGYFGGLALTVYMMAITLQFLYAAASSPSPGRVFGLAFLFYDIFVLAHVWVVAYAFVPAGIYLRERTDLLVIATILGLAGGLVSLQRQSRPIIEALKATKSNIFQQRTKLYTRVSVGVFSILACTMAFLRFPTMPYTPYHPEAKLFTAGIWTVHFGIDNEMWASEIRMRDAIRDVELDVVGNSPPAAPA